MANVFANPPSPRLPAFGLYHDEWGQLVLIDADGARHVGVTPVRMFPISDPHKWLSLINSGGREILFVEDLNDLAPKVREVVEQDLSRREFVPVIERILHVSSILEPCEWTVDTDRGRTTFVLKAEEDVRALGENRAIILDSAGIRYMVPDIASMDASSRRIMERYV